MSIGYKNIRLCLNIHRWNITFWYNPEKRTEQTKENPKKGDCILWPLEGQDEEGASARVRTGVPNIALLPYELFRHIHNNDMFPSRRRKEKKTLFFTVFIVMFLLCISAKKPKMVNVDSRAKQESRLAEGGVTEYIIPRCIFISSSRKPS